MTPAEPRQFRRRLSARSTWGYKRIFPMCWFGFASVYTAAIAYAVADGDAPALMLAWPLFLSFVAFVMMRGILRHIVDEVWDEGDGLLVRNRGEEERITLPSVRQVVWERPTGHTLTLTFESPTRFGGQVTLMLPRWRLFGRHPLIAELTQRVEQARRTRRPS